MPRHSLCSQGQIGSFDGWMAKLDEFRDGSGQLPTSVRKRTFTACMDMLALALRSRQPTIAAGLWGVATRLAPPPPPDVVAARSPSRRAAGLSGFDFSMLAPRRSPSSRRAAVDEANVESKLAASAEPPASTQQQQQQPQHNSGNAELTPTMLQKILRLPLQSLNAKPHMVTVLASALRAVVLGDMRQSARLIAAIPRHRSHTT